MLNCSENSYELLSRKTSRQKAALFCKDRRFGAPPHECYERDD